MTPYWPVSRAAARSRSASASTQRLLWQSEQRYRKLFNAFSDAIVVIDSVTGRYVDCNRATLQLYGYTRQEFLRLRPEDISFQSAETRNTIRAALAGRLKRVPIRYHRKKDGTIFPIEISAANFSMGTRTYLIAIFRDITEHLEALNGLRRSEERFRQIAETVQEVVFMVDPVTGKALYVSPAYQKIWGRPLKALERWPLSWMDAIHPEDKPRMLRSMRFRKLGRAFDHLYRILRPDGELRWIHSTGYPIRDRQGKLRRIVGISQDITRRKLAEESLARSRSMVEAQEEERRRVARELHDGVSQLLSAIRLRAHAILTRLERTDPRALSEFRKCFALLDHARAEIRHISQNLRPSVLDDLGLAPALANVCDDFTARGGSPVRFTRIGLPRRLPGDVELALYRIAQEALNNIQKHSRASRVDLRLSRKKGRIVMVVQDNGKGFVSALRRKYPPLHTGQGLANMAERAAAVQGSVTITSQPGGGTKVVAAIPLKAKGADS